MSKNVRYFVGLAVVAGLAAFAGDKAASPPAQPLLERSKEIALALTACPKHIAADATVYAQEKAGYVKVKEGKNGFTAIVQRTLPNSLEPRCLDAEGSRSHLPRIIKAAELRAQGKSRQEVHQAINEMLTKGQLQAPKRAGVDYMLSTQNIIVADEEKGIVAPYPPHLMVYVPNLTNADLGSDGNPAGQAFVVDPGTPWALLIVPVIQPPAGAQAPGHKH